MGREWTDADARSFWGRNSASFSGDIKAREIVRLSRKWATGKILDVGSGSGALLDLLPDAVGSDIVVRHPRAVRASIDHLPFVDQSFDTVFATDVLEHLPGMTFDHGLTEIRRVLKDDGILIATVPFREDMSQNMVHCPQCGADFHRWGHFRYFWEGRVEAVMEQDGFRVLQLRVLPLSLMAEHRLIRYFWRTFVLLRFCKLSDIFVVARKR